jgi:hypothetical protein
VSRSKRRAAARRAQARALAPTERTEENEASSVPASESPTAPARSRRVRQVIEDAEGYTAPAPWSTRGLIALLGVVTLIDGLVSVLGYFSDRKIAYAEYVEALPFQPLPLIFLLSFLLAMPIAQRVARESRPMRILETLSVAAIALLLIFALGGLALNASKDSSYEVRLSALGIAEILAVVITVFAYPWIYRRFWMRRRPGAGR